MLVDEAMQTCDQNERKFYERKMVEDGMLMWKQQQEAARARKVYDQTQARDMMERCWPWGQRGDIKPRGLRNLRLEGLFPHQDFEKAKRHVGSLDMGRPGGGAPNVNESGRRVCRTKEDPMLRFQWGKDLRQCVDNTLRYRQDRQQKAEYKKELDKLVEEKMKQRQKEKLDSLAHDRQLLLMSPPWGKPGPGGTLWRQPGHIGLNFFKSLGYTNGTTLKKLDKEKENLARKTRKCYEDFKRTTLRPPNQIIRNERELFAKYPWDSNTTKGPNQAILRRTQLSPLRDGKENGVELVPLMIEKRSNTKIPLGTTDVTRHGNTPTVSKWAMEGNVYLRELSKQVNHKMKNVQEARLNEIEGARKHFTTWDALWGRPGHGAPRSAVRKGCIEKMLYPRMIPIAAV